MTLNVRACARRDISPATELCGSITESLCRLWLSKSCSKGRPAESAPPPSKGQSPLHDQPMRLCNLTRTSVVGIDKGGAVDWAACEAPPSTRWNIRPSDGAGQSSCSSRLKLAKIESSRFFLPLLLRAAHKTCFQCANAHDCIGEGGEVAYPGDPEGSRPACV